MPHILTYAQTLDGGGVERAQLRLARGWLALGARVTLVIGDAAGPLAAELPAGADTIVLGDARYRALMRAMPGIVRRLRPDAIFCAGNHYTGVAAWTRLRLGRACPPIVGKMSNAPDRGDHGPLVGIGHRAWLGSHRFFLDHLVAMTPATERGAAAALGMAKRTSVIPNPPPSIVAGVRRPTLPAGRFVLGVGRLAPQKRWDRLVAAIPMLPADVTVAILGEGALRATLTAQAAALGVAERLWLVGHVADPLPAMAQAAVVALTSEYEGVPGVLREALAMGTPVVTTRSSASIAEIVDDPAKGTIVARDDAAGLAGALTRWLAPDAVRPAPVPLAGSDSAARYLALFERLIG